MASSVSTLLIRGSTPPRFNSSSNSWQSSSESSTIKMRKRMLIGHFLKARLEHQYHISHDSCFPLLHQPPPNRGQKVRVQGIELRERAVNRPVFLSPGRCHRETERLDGTCRFMNERALERER